MAAVGIHPVLRFVRRLGATLQDAGLGDGALIDRFIRNHDQAAFEALLGRHGPMVWAVCTRLLADRHEAEDAFQATWLVFARRAHAVGHPERLANWLYGVSHKVAARLRTQILRRNLAMTMLTPRTEVSADPSHAETGQILHEELGKLPQKYRAPLVLCYLEGRRQHEAAQLLGCSAGAIHGRLERGRLQLRHRLQRRGVALSVGALAALLHQEAMAAAMPLAVARATTTVIIQYLANPASAGGLCSASAAALTEGVCRTMHLAKFKVLAIIVLAAGLVGGTSLLAGRKDDAPPQQTKVKPPAKPQATNNAAPPNVTVNPQAPNMFPQQNNGWQMDWVGDQRQAAALEHELEQVEHRWVDELLVARTQLLQQQEQLKTFEQRQGSEASRLTNEASEARRQVAKAKAELSGEAGVFVGEHRSQKKLQEAIEHGLGTAAKLENQLENLRTQGTKDRIRRRVEIMASQDRVDQLERSQQRQRDRIQGDIDLLNERIRQARWGIPYQGERPEARLERKVDQLRADIDELRRDLHRKSNH